MIAVVPPRLSITDTAVPPRWWRRWQWKTAGATILLLAAYALLTSLFDVARIEAGTTAPTVTPAPPAVPRAPG